MYSGYKSVLLVQQKLQYSFETLCEHLLVGAGSDCQLQNLESVVPPETQFNWGLDWTISVPAHTLKPHSRWMWNECRGPVLLISVGNFEVQCNFKVRGWRTRR